MTRTMEATEVASAVEAAAFRAAMGGRAIADTSKALAAAMDHITELERENDGLRRIVRELAATNRRVA